MNDMNVVNTCEYVYNLLIIILECIFHFQCSYYFFLDYDDVMLTLSGLPPAFPYGRVDGVQDA